MNKKVLIAIISIIILVILIGVLYIFIKDDTISSQKKLFSFNNYNLLKEKTSLLSDQSKVDADIIKKVESGEYTFDKPLVQYNPYQISPLTAIVGFKTDKKVPITVTIKAKNNGKDLVYTTKANDKHYIPIYGLYMDYNNIVELSYNDKKTVINIPVEKSAMNIYFASKVEVNKNQLPDNDNDFIFLSTFRGSYSIAYDQSGEVRWFLTNNIYKELNKLSNGNYLLSNLNIVGNNESPNIVEVDALGKIYSNYSLENNYKYKFVELPNGNILYSSTDGRIIELDRKTGKVVKTYDLNQIINNVDKNQQQLFEEKFTGLTDIEKHDFINSLDYDKKTDSILVGIYPYSTLININKEGEINWMLAKPEYYTDKFKEYLLTPSDVNFVYPLGNYNSKYQDGKLILMDNGWDFSMSSSCSMVNELQSSARDFTIDETSKKITETKKYTKDYFSHRLGDYVVKGNERLVMFAYVFTSFEEKNDKCNMLEEPNYDSKITVLNNEEEVFEMTISNSHNYIDKRPIYDENYEFKQIETKYFDINREYDKFEKVSYKDNFKKAIKYSIPAELLGNTLKIMFQEKNYNIVLLDENGNGYKYKPENNIVNVKQGEGKLLLLIEIDNNKIYNTGYYINL